MQGLFSTAYIGSVSYFAALVKCDKIYISPNEKWQKQTYRNRCYIDAPNGKLMLNVPIDHQKSGKATGTVWVSTDENWRSKHWQAIKTTYNLSPFFDEAGPIFKEALFADELNLFQLNLGLLKAALYCLRVDERKVMIVESEAKIGEEVKMKSESESESKPMDFRNLFHPKTENVATLPPYPQVFDHKHGFLSNLSILDLIFNEGPAAHGYLRRL